jgi:signal transduction histidine kinase
LKPLELASSIRHDESPLPFTHSTRILPSQFRFANDIGKTLFQFYVRPTVIRSDPALSNPAPRVSIVYWISVVLVPVLFLLAMQFVDRSPAIDTSLLHSSAVAVVGQTDQPPNFLQQGSRVSLPDQTFAVDSDLASAWYQVDIKPTASREQWAVYFPYTKGNFELYVNGDLVRASAPMQWPFAFFRTPLYFDFPSALLRPGGNTVQVRVASVRHSAWMDPFYIGPAKALKPSFDYANFVQVTLMQATIVALCVITVLLLGLLWVRPSDTSNGWFAAATLVWALYNYLVIEPDVLLPSARVWYALPVLTIGWFSICSAHFINRLPGSDEHQRQWEKGFLWFGVLVTAGVIAQRTTSHDVSWLELYVWLPGVVLINGYIVWRLLHTVRRNPTIEARLWLLAAALTLLVGLYDYLSDRGVFISQSFHYLSYTVSFVLITFALTLLSRVSRALTDAEILNRELEHRVALRGLELARNYEKLQGLERERAISAERERMTTDMHDGIGGQLVHALAVIESDKVFQPLEPILRGALDDLRLIIDSADPTEGNLLVVLSNFRSRNERRVQERGLRFLWQVTDLPPLDDFGPHKVLQVLRVLQEALTNVFKHAHATEVIVRTSSVVDAQGRTTIVVDVIDDGRGHADRNGADITSAKPLGRGINNMRRRARELGGSIEFSTAPIGSRLRLILPIVSPTR